MFRSRSALPSTWAGAKVFYSEFLGSGKQIFYRDGPSSSVSVSEYPRDTDELELNDGVKFIRNLKVNGKSDGETSMGDTLTMRLLAHLPILLSKNPVRKVGVVGFGLGVAAGSATLYPEVESVDVMEISPAVIWASPLFDFANYEVTKNPKVRIRLGDAYRALLSTHRRYSVILSEPSNPWVTGVERLFSKEFYSLVKDKLERGGIYAQWIHEYSISEETLGLVLRTFSQSFRNVRIFRVGRDVILLGSSEEINLESLLRMESRYAENQTVRKALHQLKFKTIPSLLGLELWFRPEQFPGEN